jgi:prepilin-type N-terminal cleavage/methylation domain-containing protein
MTASAETKPLSNHQAPLRQQKGYSIIELSIALAIISIILVTALAGVQRILRSNSVNEDLKNLSLMASKTAVILTNVPSTANITQANLVNLRVFEGFRVANNNVTNAFGGAITVVPNTGILGNNKLLRCDGSSWVSMLQKGTDGTNGTNSTSSATARLCCVPVCSSIHRRLEILWLKFCTNLLKVKPLSWIWAVPTSKSFATSAAVCQKQFSENKKPNLYQIH